jgi:putative addiction module CopG family antidote
MNVSLTPELERLVREKVASGLYNNASEVVREALRAMYATAEKPPEKRQVAAAIRAIEPELRASGVKGLRIFGSVARGDATAESDVDVLIEVDPKFGLLDQAGVQGILGRVLGRRVDVVLASGLRKALGPSVLKDAERVF